MQQQRLETFMVSGGAGAIEAQRNSPQDAPPKGVAVITHPHPLFGGTMHNKVVQTLARAFVQSGWEVVRFNFRGVGASQGVYDEGKGELEDLLSVIEQTAPEGKLALAGFSFGAFVSSHAVQAIWQQSAAQRLEKVILVGTAASRFDVAPLPQELHSRSLVIHGQEDDTVPLSSVMDWALPQQLPVTVVPGCEHFFHGKLTILKSLALRHISAQTSAQNPD